MTLTMLLRWQSAVSKTDAMSLPSVDLSEAAPTVEEADRRPADTQGC